MTYTKHDIWQSIRETQLIKAVNAIGYHLRCKKRHTRRFNRDNEDFDQEYLIYHEKQVVRLGRIKGRLERLLERV
jgi:hypothetical protein